MVDPDKLEFTHRLCCWH